MIGTTAETVEHLRDQTTKSFVAAVYSLQLGDESNADSNIAIFLSQRHYLVFDAADHVLVQLRLGRERLQQMLENRPGALPTPLSQRRWASSFNLDFLSDYSFRTRRNVAYLAAALSDRQGLKDDPNDFMEKLDKKLCEYEDMFHGIGYESGSFADAEHVPTPGRSSSAAPDSRSHLMIASSYFYPEQPALLPLLAHEFAHYQLHHIAESVSQRDSIDWHFEQAITDAVNKIGGSAGEPLLALPYSKDVQYIHDIVVMVYHELKADFIAFSLHGSAYVHALLLNLLGSEGASRYTVNRSRHNAAIYREVFVQNPKAGSTNAPSNPSEIGNTLRLYFCTQLLKATESDEAHGFQHVAAFRESVERLTKSYLSGMQSLTENDSKHERWNYFFKLIAWLQPSVLKLAESLWNEFGTIAKEAASFGQGNCVSEPVLQSSLEKMVSDYCTGTIVGLLKSKEAGKGHDITEIEFKLSASKAGAAPQLVCVETAPLAVRWHFALLYQQLLPLKDSQPVFSERVCGPLVNYLRNDGSVISRYLMEYIVARKHCIQKLAADIRGLDVPKLSPVATAVRAKCLAMMQSEPGLLTRTTYLSGKNQGIDLTLASAQRASNVVADFVGSVLAEEQVPWRHIQGEFVPIRGSTTQFAEKTRELCEALGKLCDTTNGAPVGMLELGAMMFFSGPSEPDSAYLKLYKQLHDQTTKQQMQLNKKVQLNQEGSQPFALATVDLLGDYNYATFMRGTTPAERDMVIGKPLPIVSKARFVVQVHGRADWGEYDKTKYPVRAITLIRLPHRHLWTELVTALPAHIECNAFLSTGWETLVLDWRVKASCEFWNFTEYFLGKRGDSHTMMAGDALGGGDILNDQNFENVCDTNTKNFRTGRYDYGGNVAKATAPEMFQKLASLSNATWKGTHKISMEAKLDSDLQPCGDQSFSWMLRQMGLFL